MKQKILIFLFKPFANFGRFSRKNRPNFAMRLFMYLNGNKFYYVHDFNRVIIAPTLKKAHEKMTAHNVVQLKYGDALKYILFGTTKNNSYRKPTAPIHTKYEIGHFVQVVQNKMFNGKQLPVIVQHYNYGKKMRISFLKDEIRLKIDTKHVSKDFINRIKNNIRIYQVNQSLRSSFCLVENFFNDEFHLSLFNCTKPKRAVAIYVPKTNMLEYNESIKQEG